MKKLFIGDIHGLSNWDEIVYKAFTHFYDVVFLGDYVDSFHIKGEEQIKNLKNLIDLKKKYPDKVTLLLGNHDYAYINNFSRISGYQFHNSETFRILFTENKDLFQIATGFYHSITRKYTLVSHAGLTYNYWINYIKPLFDKEESSLKKIFDYNNDPIHKILNALVEIGDGSTLLWKVGRKRGGSGTPGPLWADYTELLDDPYPDINQIFGHTPSISPRLYHDKDNFYACIDDWRNKKIVSMIIDV